MLASPVKPRGGHASALREKVGTNRGVWGALWNDRMRGGLAGAPTAGRAMAQGGAGRRGRLLAGAAGRPPRVGWHEGTGTRAIVGAHVRWRVGLGYEAAARLGSSSDRQASKCPFGGEAGGARRSLARWVCAPRGGGALRLTCRDAGGAAGAPSVVGHVHLGGAARQLVQDPAGTGGGEEGQRRLQDGTETV